jgi:DNA-binding IscR family transcriptional regulator
MLRLGGFVVAARGTGGYSLARPANRIDLSDVMAVLGGRLFEGSFCETHPGQLKSCVRLADCSVRVLWRALQEAIDDVLRRTTLQDLLFTEQQMITWIEGLGEITSPLARQ